MRQIAMCLTILLCSLVGAVGQAPEDSGFRHHHPRIVAKVKLLNQTAVISPTAIYTPRESGMYRVSTVMVLTRIGTGEGNTNFYWGQLTFQSGKTPGSVNATNLLFVAALGATQGVSSVVSSAGHPIMFYTFASGDVTNSMYNVYIVVERL